MTKSETLEELFLRFFLPDGYLAKKHLNQITLDSALEAAPQSFHNEILNVVDEKKTISQELIRIFKKNST